MMRRVAITGARGFLGSHLMDSFGSAGWQTVGVLRPGRQPRESVQPPGDVRWVNAALEAESLAPVFEGCGVVIHLAGIAKARDQASFDAVNVAGTEAVARAANQAQSRVLFVSSQAAAGVGTREHPAREDEAPQPMTAYGRSKLRAERVLAHTAQQPSVVVRPSAIYGPRDRQFLPLFRLAKRGWFLQVANPHASFTLLHVEDFARALLLMAERLMADQIPGPLFLGHPTPQSAESVLRNIGRAVGRPYRATRVPPWMLRVLAAVGEMEYRMGRIPLVDNARLAELRADGFVCSTERARQTLGFTAAVDFEQGILRTADWYTAQGWL
jgi:nucleoside-diphosphate-sugar epimerase